MKAIEFHSEMKADGTLTVPAGIAHHLPAGQPVRVLVLIAEQSEDAQWERFAAEEFGRGIRTAMPSTTNYHPGDLVLVDFPFTAGSTTKPRPALVVLDSGDADVLLARVTTQAYSTAYDVSLSGWQQAGLLAPSVVRVHKQATLEKGRVRKRLGSLDATDRQQVGVALRQMIAAW